MNLIERMLFEQRGGMFREFTGVGAFLEPADRSLYEKLLPRPFGVPDKPVVFVFVADYIRVFPWPMSRYQEWAVLLRSDWRGTDGWHVVSMPVTKWLPMRGGRYLGFPKYVVDAIAVTKQGEIWKAESRNRGALQLSVELRPGLTRQLAPWESELMSNQAFFKGNVHLLRPPGKGPKAQTVKVDYVVSPHWSPEVGMATIKVDSNERWAGLIPTEGLFLGTYNHFVGGINLVPDR